MCMLLIIFTASTRRDGVGIMKTASFIYVEYSDSSPPKFLKNGKTLSRTWISIFSPEYSVQTDHLQSSCPAKTGKNFSPESFAFCSRRTSSSSSLFMKIRYDICSIACIGLEIPPLQNLSQSKLIFDFNSDSSIQSTF